MASRIRRFYQRLVCKPTITSPITAQLFQTVLPFSAILTDLMMSFHSYLGGIVTWERKCRFKHVGTGKYLSINMNPLTANSNRLRQTGSGSIGEIQTMPTTTATQPFLMLTNDIRYFHTLFLLKPVELNVSVSILSIYLSIYLSI